MNSTLLDILLILALFIATAMGYRGGVRKKLFNILLILLCTVAVVRFTIPLGVFFTEDSLLPEPQGYIVALLLVLGATAIPLLLLYRHFERSWLNTEFTQMLGGIFGLFEGAFFISLVLLFCTLSGTPARQARDDSMLYKPLVGFAPGAFRVIEDVLPGSEEFRVQVSRMFERYSITERSDEAKEKL